MNPAAPEHRTQSWRQRLLAHRDDHAWLRERFGHKPEAGFEERVLKLYQPAEWAVGSIGVLDAMVLRDLVHALRPGHVIEIGTAAGTSSVLLAGVMREAGCAIADAPAVTTFDLHPWCYFDRTRAVGSAIDEADPAIAAMIDRRVRTTAADAGRAFAGRNIALAFVDADHRHPAPCVDVLALVPAMAPGGWIVLHDIDLPAEAERYEACKGVRVDWKQHGAKWLFDAWPFEKLVPPGHRNIGAVRLPTDRTLTAAALASCLHDPAKPWEMSPTAESLRLIGRPHTKESLCRN